MSWLGFGIVRHDTRNFIEVPQLTDVKEVRGGGPFKTALYNEAFCGNLFPKSIAIQPRPQMVRYQSMSTRIGVEKSRISIFFTRWGLTVVDVLGIGCRTVLPGAFERLWG